MKKARALPGKGRLYRNLLISSSTASAQTSWERLSIAAVNWSDRPSFLEPIANRQGRWQRPAKSVYMGIG